MYYNMNNKIYTVIYTSKFKYTENINTEIKNPQVLVSHLLIVISA